MESDKLDNSFDDQDKILQLEQPSTDIKIQVIQGKSRGHNITSYIGYVISITAPQQYRVERRYRQFAALRQVMQKRWPGCIIPVLPRKHVTGSNSLKVVNQRIKYLTYFLNCLAKTKHLYDSQEFQLFLHSKDSDIQKLMKNLPKLSYQQILKNYKASFSNLSTDDTNELIVVYNEKAAPYGKLLKQSKVKMSTYKKQIRKLALAKQQYIYKCKILYNETLPQYELYLQGAVNISNYQAIKIFSDEKNQSLKQQIKKIQYQVKFNLYWLIYQAMRLQILQSEAAVQAIQGRVNLKRDQTIIIKKIQTNKQQILDIKNKNFSLKSFFSKNPQKQILQLQKNNEFLEGEKIALAELINYCTAVTLKNEIMACKEKRVRIWKKVWSKACFSQKKYVQNMVKVLNILATQ